MIGPTRGRPLALDRISSEVAQPGAMDQQVLWDFGASVHSFGGPCSATCIKCTTSPAPKRSMYRFAFPRGLGMNSCAWLMARPANGMLSVAVGAFAAVDFVVGMPCVCSAGRRTAASAAKSSDRVGADRVRSYDTNTALTLARAPLQLQAGVAEGQR